MQYRVELFNPQTRVKSEEVAHGTQAELRQRYALQGLAVLNMKEYAAKRYKASGRVSLSIAQELKVLLDSGLNIVEATEALAGRNDNSLQQTIYQRLRDDLHNGRSLSAAMEAFPDMFPDFLVASVQASEQSGTVTLALERYIRYRERLDELQGKLISAAIYPLIVLAASALVIIFLIAYVIPRFSAVFADMIDKLPLMTRLLLSLGVHISTHSGAWACGAIVFVLSAVLIFRQQKLRSAILAWLSNRKLVTATIRQYSLARLYRTLAMLQESGIPFVTAMRMCQPLVHTSLAKGFEQALTHITAGGAISKNFVQQQLADSVTQRILMAGERSGDVATAFSQMARFVEQKLAYRIDRLARVIEPTIMLVVGTLIGLIVVLMYSPIFELANTLQ